MDGTLARGTTLALRASPRAALVVVISAGPDKLVRDVVSLSGSCSLGTPPFVPTLVYAAVEGVGGGGDGGQVKEVTLARSVAVLARDGWGGSVGMGEAAGRAYCWRCGDVGHVKSACPRRGDGGGGGGGGGGSGGGYKSGSAVSDVASGVGNLTVQ